MSTAAKRDVINAALAHLGEEPVADINADPPSPKLAKVLAQLDGPAGTERWVLGRHPWLCALSYASLEPSAVIPGNWRFAKAFELPATFIKLWECSGEDYQVARVQQGSAIKIVILANADKLDVSFTEARDFEAYDGDLCNAIAYETAARTAGPLQNNYEAAARLHREAQAAIGEAETGEAGQHGGGAPLIGSGLADARALGA